jgi:DNA repair protein RadA/Sms
VAKAKTVFFCGSCGYESSKWMGRCPGCGEWNTFIEEKTPPPGADRGWDAFEQRPAQLLREIPAEEGRRVSSGMTELDRVLGGGIIPASLVLCGGDPGIGKSTLLLQMAGHLSAAGHRALYVTAEESAAQIRMRAARLNVNGDALYILAQTRLEAILDQIARIRPAAVVVDSIQTVYSGQSPSAPGSVSQVRECAMELLQTAKSSGAAIFLVGHVTKEGTLAGPRVLEHMVDTVLYFEGERQHAFRILRAAKNRFGSTNEIGIFEMESGGMTQVVNPSEIFLSGERADVPGSVATCTMEGARPVLVEVQALISPTAFGTPRRMTTGMDYNRAVMLLAVLEKKAGLSLQNQDVYVNVAGGLRIVETAADLALIASAASGARNRPVPPDTAVIGEVGLTGEVRAVSNMEKRLTECHKLGFTRVVGPRAARRALSVPQGLEYVAVRTVQDALKALL